MAIATKDCLIDTQQDFPFFESTANKPIVQMEVDSCFEDRKFNPADIVVCSKFGIGKMTGVEHVDGLGRSFFTIESLDHKMKNMIPVDSDILIRKVSTKTSFTKSLEKVAEDNSKSEFDSRKDRIAHYQERIRSNKATLGTVLEVIRDIQSLKDKGTVERQMMNELLDTVSKEYSFVFECDMEIAKKRIKKSLVQ